VAAGALARGAHAHYGVILSEDAESNARRAHAASETKDPAVAGGVTEVEGSSYRACRFPCCRRPRLQARLT